jgi:ABC-type sugar transport system substrate-binding protein
MNVLTGRRQILGALAATILSIGLVTSGCGGTPDAASGGTGGDKPKIGVMLFSTELPFYAPLQEGINAKAAELGVDVDIQSGQLDPARQAQLVQQFVTQGKDAIIISASDADAVVPAVRQANAANIPVLGLTNDIGSGAERLTYVGTNNVEFGKLLGEGAAKVGGEKAKVAVILGALGTTSQRDRTEGIEKYIADHPGMTIVDKQTANWDNAQALKVGQDFLSKHPKGTLDVIVTEGPEGATAAKFAAANGRTDVKFVVGDVSRDVRDQLKAGTIAAAVFQNPYDQGQTGVQYAVDAANGKAADVPSPNAFQPLELYTGDDADKIPENALF